MRSRRARSEKIWEPIALIIKSEESCVAPVWSREIRFLSNLRCGQTISRRIEIDGYRSRRCEVLNHGRERRAWRVRWVVVINVCRNPTRTGGRVVAERARRILLIEIRRADATAKVIDT